MNAMLFETVDVAFALSCSLNAMAVKYYNEITSSEGIYIFDCLPIIAGYEGLAHFFLILNENSCNLNLYLVIYVLTKLMKMEHLMKNT